MSKRFIIFGFLALITLFLDVVLGFARVPILTFTLCGIVIVYEIVRPFIYTSR